MDLGGFLSFDGTLPHPQGTGTPYPWVRDLSLSAPRRGGSWSTLWNSLSEPEGPGTTKVDSVPLLSQVENPESTQAHSVTNTLRLDSGTTSHSILS